MEHVTSHVALTKTMSKRLLQTLDRWNDTRTCGFRFASISNVSPAPRYGVPKICFECDIDRRAQRSHFWHRTVSNTRCLSSGSTILQRDFLRFRRLKQAEAACLDQLTKLVRSTPYSTFCGLTKVCCFLCCKLSAVICVGV